MIHLAIIKISRARAGRVTQRWRRRCIRGAWGEWRGAVKAQKRPACLLVPNVWSVSCARVSPSLCSGVVSWCLYRAAPLKECEIYKEFCVQTRRLARRARAAVWRRCAWRGVADCFQVWTAASDQPCAASL